MKVHLMIRGKRAVCGVWADGLPTVGEFAPRSNVTCNRCLQVMQAREQREIRASAVKELARRVEAFSETLSRTEFEELCAKSLILGIEYPGCNVLRLHIGYMADKPPVTVEIESVREAGMQSMLFRRIN